MPDDEIEAAILKEITRYKNRAAQPYSTWWDYDRWWVMVEVNSRRATFDVEACATDKTEALRTVLRSVRRHYSLAGAS